MHRISQLLPVLALFALLPACADSEACTLADCSSTIVVDYGAVVVNEPYSLTINPGGMTTSVTCLQVGPDAEPLPEWIECDANGFEISGDFGTTTTITVGVVPLSTQEAVVANALVPLTVTDVIEPNGPDCDPVCYRRVGSTQGL